MSFKAGTYIFKPLQAHLFHNRSQLGKMDPYCEIAMGKQKIKGQIDKGGGQSLQWIDVIIMRADSQDECTIQVKNRTAFRADRLLGECFLDLQTLTTRKNSLYWLDIFLNDQKEGELLIEINYKPDNDYLLDSSGVKLSILKEKNRLNSSTCEKFTK